LMWLAYSTWFSNRLGSLRRVVIFLTVSGSLRRLGFFRSLWLAPIFGLLCLSGSLPAFGFLSACGPLCSFGFLPVPHDDALILTAFLSAMARSAFRFAFYGSLVPFGLLLPFGSLVDVIFLSCCGSLNRRRFLPESGSLDRNGFHALHWLTRCAWFSSRAWLARSRWFLCHTSTRLLFLVFSGP
jgi:hypothetical protein